MLNADRAVDPEYGARKAAKGQTITLADQVRWPTPLPSDVDGGRTTKGKDRPNEAGLRVAVGGQLNPTWVEWLMGFPLGWTDLGPLETPSSPKSPSTSDTES